MICRYCDGKGDHGSYDPHDPLWVALDPDDLLDRHADPGVSICEFCGGSGRLSPARWAWLVWTISLPVRAEALAMTRFGAWWWRVAWRYVRARRLGRGLPAFTLQAKHGHRLEQLNRMTLMAHECGGEPHYEAMTKKQRRLVWEAARACENRLVSR